ncbi:17151_t:CDS:2 [Cetraspora pellucida]|uniref:17151_t:CDS:1 n=1 Tax=Cetraspora pellucida TaxID=1433469 RepID=A0ACA9L875_9GLOM|nr:17151_t:CDS:2 [Cetraspora pellucida]
MFNKIRDYYYWPQIYNDIWKYMRTCKRCQKQSDRKSKEPLHPIPVEAPFHKIGIDIWPEAHAIPRDNAEKESAYRQLTCIITNQAFIFDPLLPADEWATSIQQTPFYLVYKRKAWLSIHSSETDNLLDRTLIQRIYKIDNELPEKQSQDLCQIKLNQQKQKERHDQHITTIPDFGIGDKVLVYDIRRMELGGKILAAPINKKLLKLYQERKV